MEKRGVTVRRVLRSPGQTGYRIPGHTTSHHRCFFSGSALPLDVWFRLQGYRPEQRSFALSRHCSPAQGEREHGEGLPSL